MDESDFPIWRKTIGTLFGAAMFVAFTALCWRTTGSLWATVAFAVVTLVTQSVISRREI